MADRIYAPLQRPPAWVEDDDRWFLGRLHAWRHDHTGWWAVASWHVGVGLQKYQDVPAARLMDGDKPDPNVEEEGGDVEPPWVD